MWIGLQSLGGGGNADELHQLASALHRVPARQAAMLHQGLGAIYVASNLEEFVTSAQSRADFLVQQELSAQETAKQADANAV